MVKLALLVTVGARLGKEAEVEAFLRNSLPVVQKEPGTVAWFGIRVGPSGSSTRFSDEAGRQVYLSGLLAAALMEKAPELSTRPS